MKRKRIKTYTCPELPIVSYYERSSDFMTILAEFFEKSQAFSRHIHLYDPTFTFFTHYNLSLKEG